MARNQAENQLFDLLVTRDFDPQTLDSQGKPAATPEAAHLFSFDYKGESGRDYGTVVVMLNDDNSMTVYTGDNTGKSMEGDDKKGWFDFQAQLKRFAMKNLLSFNLQNLNKLKYSMQGQAALKEGLFESWQGKRDVSYNADATQARLMIKHKRNIGEGEARFRNIQALFIETADGERFKLPFTKLSGGRAMLEHVRQGGRPYDMRGAHIATIVNEMNLLARFRRANQSRIFEGEVANLVEQANNYYATLQHSLKSLGSHTGYTKYFESWNPADIKDEDVIIEDLRHMFVEQNIDARVEQALPLLAKLQQEQAMKEINVFEGWMNLLSEGTWALPDSKEKQQQLVTLLSAELPVGPDATNATEQLYDVLGDDVLFDRLAALAEQDANADARTVVLERLEEMKDNPAVAQVIGKLKIESTPQEQPVQEGLNSYDIENTPCPKCHEKELTYLQGTNHCKCGACGKSFSLAGKTINEFAPGGGHGDEDHLLKLARAWAHASEANDDQAINQAEAALAEFGYGISEIEDGSEAVQLVPTGEYMIDWNDNDIIVFNPDELDEMGGAGMQKVFHKGQWLPASQVPKNELMAVREGESCHACHQPVCECSLEEAEDTVEKDPATGKVKSWSHEGDWEKVKKRDGKAVDPRGEVTHMSDRARRETEKLDELDKDTLGSYIKKASSDRAMRNFDQGVDMGASMDKREPNFGSPDNSRRDDNRRGGIRKAVDRLVRESRVMESGMSEVDILLQEIARGNVDIYDVFAAPKSNVEKFVSDQIHKKAEEVAREQGYNLDDDIEDILARVQRELEAEYGVDDNMDIELEGAIGKALGAAAGMALAPEVPGSGMIGGMIGDKISGDDEVEETVGGGNWLEEGELNIGDRVKCPNGIIGEIIADEGDRWIVVDAHSEFDDDQLEFRKSDCVPLRQRGLRETTALTGQYGHSGKLQTVKPQDADMMDRIKFLAGITK